MALRQIGMTKTRRFLHSWGNMERGHSCPRPQKRRLLFPALRSGPTPASGASRQKQIPGSDVNKPITRTNQTTHIRTSRKRQRIRATRELLGYCRGVDHHIIATHTHRAAIHRGSGHTTTYRIRLAPQEKGCDSQREPGEKSVFNSPFQSQ